MSESVSDTIIYQVNNEGVAVLKVNRPHARNALNWAAQERFAEIVKAIVNDSFLRALIITGSGDRAFVSGGDLKELHQHPEREAGERLNRVMSNVLNQLRQLPIPVIAAVNGDAFGGGCEIVAACDLRLASARARFGFAQIKNALTTGWGGTSQLVRLIGQSRALELLLTGRIFDAEEAQQLGLIHRLIPETGDVLAAAHKWADEILLLPQETLAATKRLVYATGYLTDSEVAQLETALFVGLWDKQDHLEALQAFAEKRLPIFNQSKEDLPE